MNALGDVAAMTETGPRKHHTKGPWSFGERLQNFEKKLLCGGVQDDGREFVVGPEDLTNLRGAQRVGRISWKNGSTASEGTRLVCSVEEIGSSFHVQLLRRMGECVLLVWKVVAEHGVRWVRAMCNTCWKGRISLEEFWCGSWWCLQRERSRGGLV